MLLGTWNLENLFLPGRPSGPKDKAAYETKLASLAAVITELDPTLLGVQEVGDVAALRDLLGMVGGDWHTAVSEHPDGREIRVGFISRVPLAGAGRHHGAPAEACIRDRCRWTTRAGRPGRRAGGSWRWRRTPTPGRCGWPYAI